MSLQIHSEDYTQWHSPIESVLSFFKGTLTQLGWNRSDGNEVIMDIGCGSGGTTKEVILPFLSKLGRIIALDVMPDMIDIGKQKNAHPQIEYVVGDIAEWSTLQQWKGKMAKTISILCFHWVKNQKVGFQNIYKLLMTGGEAALLFVLEATFFDAVEELQKSSKWCQYLKGHDNGIPDSHHFKYGASYYKEMAEEVGFEVLHCKEEKKIDACPDERYKNLFSSLCVLVPYVPEEHKEDFKNDIYQHTLDRNGRTDNGFPFHKSIMLEMVVRKK